jgi:magnesium transporter
LEKYIGVNKWKWVQLKNNGIDNVQLPNEQDNAVNAWLEHVHNNKWNCLRGDFMENGEKVVKGSLIYQKDFAEERDFKIFHFHLSTDQLVTVDLELTVLKHINPNILLRQINRTENAIDGFLLILGELVKEMLVEIDKFEEALNSLIWSMREGNETGILELVYNRRHELLIWKNLLIPINEVKMAIEETNFQGNSRGGIFACICKRIERAMVLLNEYEHQMDSIINLEEVSSSHRGNEIMKTLTVITTVFTPIMAFGALWGMNFIHMPELEWQFGYLLAIIMITISTLLLYGYLKIKGWTGDLLKGKKKGSFFQ